MKGKEKKKGAIFFGDELEDIFIKNLKKYTLPKLGPQTSSNVFYLKTSSNSEKMKKFHLDLHGSIIILRYPN